MKAFRDALQSGRPQIGFCIMYPAPGIIERVGPDWDWIWIDGQHGEIDYAETLAIVRACNLAGRPAFPRVASHEFGAVGKALDTAADGVIVPVVDTPEEARAVVKAAKFPPLGGRSYGGRRPVDLSSRLYADTANEDTILICQIESPLAIDNVDAIAAIDGVDALFLGPDDIMLRRGYPMNAPRNKETLGRDMEAVANACAKHGKFSVIVGFGDEMLELCLSMAFNMIVCGGDVAFLANTSRDTSAHVREIVGTHGKGSAAETTPGSPY